MKYRNKDEHKKFVKDNYSLTRLIALMALSAVLLILLIYLEFIHNSNENHHHNHYENEVNDIKKMLSVLEDRVSILENKGSLMLDFESRPVNKSHKHTHLHTNIPKIMKKLSE